MMGGGMKWAGPPPRLGDAERMTRIAAIVVSAGTLNHLSLEHFGFNIVVLQQISIREIDLTESKHRFSKQRGTGELLLMLFACVSVNKGIVNF
jgi:hypothetical protein